VNREEYRFLAMQKPTSSSLGGIYIAIVDTRPGFERAYNRWYEQDHFYSAAMAGPWVFSGRRWIATPELRAARIPADDPSASRVSGPQLLATYFLTDGHVEDAREWMLTMHGDNLVPDGRGFAERDPVYGGWHDVRSAVVFDPPPMTPEVALDHPYAAVAIEIVDSIDAASRDVLIEWLRRDLIPGSTERGQCIVVTPTELDDHAREKGYAEADDKRVLLAWFLPRWSAQEWSAQFGNHAGIIHGSGLGSLVSVTPYLPLVPGTDRYIDEI
jgi:hypothetical protein